ncbi:hypothetical protein B0T09DRAFT_165762 [Sordaria sp. MPI-SDFR-AT-0083]|nr:hypothetical protein B0T09DRAFT_165762 [Sordaria sp. MPI-SDFR-AT-0083]
MLVTSFHLAVHRQSTLLLAISPPRQIWATKERVRNRNGNNNSSDDVEPCFVRDACNVPVLSLNEKAGCCCSLWGGTAGGFFHGTLTQHTLPVRIPGAEKRAIGRG